jgi:hypothetical protein
LQPQRTAAVALGVLLLVLATSATASLGASSPFRARLVSAIGTVELGGDLIALDLVSSGPVMMELAESSGRVVATSDYANYSSTPVSTFERDAGTMFHGQPGSRFDSLALKPGYRVFVSGVPGGREAAPWIVAVGDSVELRPSYLDELAAPKYTFVRPHQGIDLQSASQLRGFQGHVQMSIHGSFRLNLWEVDVHLNNPDGLEVVLSGHETRPVVPVSGSETLFSDETFRQAFIDIYDGHLQLKVPAEQIKQLYVEDLHVAVSGQVQSIDVGNKTLIANGKYAGTVGRADEHLLVELHATKTPSVPMNRPAMALEPETVAAWPSQNVLILQGLKILTAFLVVGTIAVTTHRVVGMIRFRSLENAFVAGNDEKVRSSVAPERHLAKNQWEAGAMHVISRLRQGDAEGALKIIGWLEGHQAAKQDGLDYLLACVAVSLGEREEAERLLSPLVEPQLEIKSNNWSRRKAAQPDSGSHFGSAAVDGYV